jgi:hypothetical protein
VDISTKDDVTIVLLLGVSFMGSTKEIENKQGLGVVEKPPWRFFEGKQSTDQGKQVVWEVNMTQCSRVADCQPEGRRFDHLCSKL